MKSLKKGLIHFFISSFFIFVPAAPCLAAPDSEVFPPLPLDQEEHEDNAKDRKFPHPPFDSENIMKYRGQRTYSDQLPLTVNNIKCKKIDDRLVALEITFNQSINPHTVRPGSILINNRPLGPEVRIAFNRKGDTIKVLLHTDSKSFKLKLQKAASFDGSWLEPMEALVEVQDSI